MRGLVVKNTGSSYVVRTEDRQLVNCVVKGSFRIKGIRTTNPVAIGDRVVIGASKSGHSPADYGKGSNSPTHFITAIEDRRNWIIRKSINLSKQSHILAANVDQAMLMATITHPQTSTTFIDRFLASAEAYRVPVILLFNKTDLLDDDMLHLQQMMITLYENIGYQCLPISATTGEGLDKLRPLLQGKITLLSGNSGVGKSTLINSLVPGACLRTAELSDAHDAGQHTTTFSEMIEVPISLSEENTHASAIKDDKASEGTIGEASPTYLIDTPGIKGFGTFDMEPEEISGYFKEIFHFSKDCRFNNCTHTHEPGCAVLQALDNHYIAQSRYQSYLSMLHDKDESKYREAY